MHRVDQAGVQFAMRLIVDVMANFGDLPAVSSGNGDGWRTRGFMLSRLKESWLPTVAGILIFCLVCAVAITFGWFRSRRKRAALVRADALDLIDAHGSSAYENALEREREAPLGAMAGDSIGSSEHWRQVRLEIMSLTRRHVGNIYDDRHGVPQDYGGPVNRKTADQRAAQSLNNLGVSNATRHDEVQDHAEAIKWRRNAANQGDQAAKSDLRNILANGLGVPRTFETPAAPAVSAAPTTPAAGSRENEAAAAYQREDYAKALQIWRPLADEGFPTAQVNLGLMYENGRGVQQDYAEAAQWFRKAADRGDAQGQLNLGRLYRLGQGVPQNRIDAAKWYRNAANQGLAKAQNNLAIMYATGQGIPQDHVQAHVLFTLAAARGTQDALKNRDLLAVNMTPAQIAEAQRLAREWKPTK